LLEKIRGYHQRKEDVKLLELACTPSNIQFSSLSSHPVKSLIDHQLQTRINMAIKDHLGVDPGKVGGYPTGYH
jgi:hypothetical protein